MITIEQSVGNIQVNGFVAPAFEKVATAFIKNFRDHAEVGAACTVYHQGKAVADLWGGLADPDRAIPWREDTVVLVFSATKAITATCINRLIEAGQLDPDLPVAHYWPEFARNGKQHISTRQVLSHQAGLAVVTAELSLEEVLAWDPVVEAIAAQAPVWEPGSAHGYHARSFGWILGELLKRITGRSIGAYIADEICAPLNLDFWVGLPEQLQSRCARIIPPPGGSDAVAELLGADSLTAQVMSGPSNLFGYNEMWNRPEILSAQMPSSNGVGNARSLARFYAALLDEVDGTRLLGPEQLALACSAQAQGPDKVIFRDTCYGLGFMLQPGLAPEWGPNCFGHPGAGGAMAFADPDQQFTFAYVMNAMKFDLQGDPRSTGLVQAVYESL